MMYVVRRRTGANVAFKTYDGWVECDRITGVLDLSDVIRFTEREAHLNKLPDGEQMVVFGCYNGGKR